MISQKNDKVSHLYNGSVSSKITPKLLIIILIKQITKS